MCHFCCLFLAVLAEAKLVKGKHCSLTLSTKRGSRTLHTSGALGAVRSLPLVEFLYSMFPVRNSSSFLFFKCYFYPQSHQSFSFLQGEESRSSCSHHTQTSFSFIWLTTDLCFSTCNCQFMRAQACQASCCNLCIKFQSPLLCKWHLTWSEVLIQADCRMWLYCRGWKRWHFSTNCITWCGRLIFTLACDLFFLSKIPEGVSGLAVIEIF